MYLDLCFGVVVVDFFVCLWVILLVVEVNDGNLEEGSLCCDVNILVWLRGVIVFGVKVEVKNLNFFWFLKCVIDYEFEC